MQNYQITIFTRKGRIERNVTAASRRAALTVALNVLPEDEIPMAIICKTHAEACGLQPSEEAIG